MSAPRELSLKEFIDSSWFKLLARGAAILGVAGAGYAGSLLTVNSLRLDEIEKDRAMRISINDTRDMAAAEAIVKISSDVADLHKDIEVVKQSQARSEGMLSILLKTIKTESTAKSDVILPAVNE